MKNKVLQVLLLFLFFGCTPGLEKIYKQIQIPGSEFLYLTSLLTIDNELGTLQKTMDAMLNDSLKIILESQYKTMQTFKMQCMNDSLTRAMVYYKPPNPCPPVPGPGFFSSAKFLVFYSLSDWGNIEIHLKGRLIHVVKKGWFNEQTKIRIVRLPCKLKAKSGDTIVVKLPIEYLDKSGKKHQRIIEYKEIIQ